MSIQKKPDSRYVKQLRELHTSNTVTGYSYFESTDEGKFGIGTLIIFIQIAAMILLLYAFASISDLYEPISIIGLSIAPVVVIVAALVAYVLLQIPCFFIAEKYKETHYGAILNQHFFHMTIVSIIILVPVFALLFLFG